MKKVVLSALILLGINSVYAQKKENPFLWEKGNTTIKLGGFVRVVTSADFDGSVASNDFIVSSIPVPQPWDNKGRFGLDASASRLNLEVVQKIEGIGNLKFYIESDFRGASDVFRLRQAYVSFLGITAGQTWSFMYDAAATAPSIDIQGDDSRTFFRTPLIGYSRRFGDHFSAGAAIEYPKAKITTTTGVKSVAQRIPDFSLYVQYKGAAGHLKLAGVMRGVQYGNTGNEKIESEFGWGVQLSGSVKPAKFLTLYAQGIYGAGIGRYINDLAYLSVDLMPDYNEAGVMRALPMYGVSFGARADLSKKFYVAASVARAQMTDWKCYTMPSDFHKGSYASGTIFWRAFKNMTVAAEYLYGKRENIDHQSGQANRVQLMLKYDF